MTNRWLKIVLCGLAGLALLIDGLLIPAHLRAVESCVLERAGKSTARLPDKGLALVSNNQLGAAEMLLRAGIEEHVPGLAPLSQAVTNLAAQHPDWQVWGGGEYHLEMLFGNDARLPKHGSEPFTEWAVREENRARVLELLRTSSRPAVQELLRCRTLTNTRIFSPSESSSGQALDAAVSVCGLLLEEGTISTELSHSILTLATQARTESLPLERVLLDLMSLGQRFNWSQLAVFVAPIQDLETLRIFAEAVREPTARLPVLFSTAILSGRPADVATYLVTYSRTGLQDLGTSLRYGAGGLEELLRSGQRLQLSTLPWALGVDWSWRMPWLAVAIKWFFYLLGGFLLALAAHYSRPAVSELEQPLQVGGIHIAREILFALGLLVVILLVTEPFLSQESQRVQLSFSVHLPMVGSVANGGVIKTVKTSLMNEKSLLTLLLFFVLQGLLYVACLFKLAEIRRQKVAPRIKLRLLENEDHLFDAGLYLGFVGTIISLILFSLGVIRPSLMAAYSSTSFGIIFVSFFKIFHLRPARRKILMEAELNSPEPLAPVTAARLATPS
jgi:hypothetical protein